GILVKDGSALERLSGIDRALLDKTGTLTLGRPTPDAAALDAMDEEDCAVALALASHSRHPISLGLSRALAERGVVAAPLGQVEERIGWGLVDRWQGQE